MIEMALDWSFVYNILYLFVNILNMFIFSIDGYWFINKNVFLE